ncbi:hypothetical protein, partial [uncultured Rhodoblastus sp.]|uniref:hypothetical protein n=1 Tax=uncultured Rhodoblastus sp. TaxID=543037 RepID=UPI0025DB407A
MVRNEIPRGTPARPNIGAGSRPAGADDLPILTLAMATKAWRLVRRLKPRKPIQVAEPHCAA